LPEGSSNAPASRLADGREFGAEPCDLCQPVGVRNREVLLQRDALLPLLLDFDDALLPLVLDFDNALLPLVLDFRDALLPLALDFHDALLPLALDFRDALLPLVLDFRDALLPLTTHFRLDLSEPSLQDRELISEFGYLRFRLRKHCLPRFRLHDQVANLQSQRVDLKFVLQLRQFPFFAALEAEPTSDDRRAHRFGHVRLAKQITVALQVKPEFLRDKAVSDADATLDFVLLIGTQHELRPRTIVNERIDLISAESFRKVCK
jgi:hypothetical protein